MGAISVEKMDHLFWLGRYTDRVYTTVRLFFQIYDNMIEQPEGIYEKYCERMYNYGYMDKDYNWTPAATNVINNMNASNMQKLDENAKQIVQERIDSGEMEAIDSPYLTYDQKQELIKKQEQESQQQSTGEGSEEGSLIETETSATPEAEISEEPIEENAITKVPDEQQEQEEQKPEENKTRNTIGWVVIILFFTIIATIAYSIYRRQF